MKSSFYLHKKGAVVDIFFNKINYDEQTVNHMQRKIRQQTIFLNNHVAKDEFGTFLIVDAQGDQNFFGKLLAIVFAYVPIEKLIVPNAFLGCFQNSV